MFDSKVTDDEQIVIKFKDETEKQEFRLSRRDSSLSLFLKNATDDEFDKLSKNSSSNITTTHTVQVNLIPDIQSNIIGKIVEYLNHYNGTKPNYTFKKPINYNKMNDIEVICADSETITTLGAIDPWAAKFADGIINQNVEVYNQQQTIMLYGLLCVSNYLIISPLCELMTVKFATLLKRLDSVETCKRFGIDQNIADDKELTTKVEDMYPDLLKENCT